MKKYSIEEIEKTGVTPTEEASKSEKTPVSFTKKKKNKKRKRIIIATILVIILGALGYFGWVGYNALKNIFNGDAPNLLNLFNNSQLLKGESAGRVNILLMGIGGAGHDGGDLTDTLMLVSLDTKSNRVAMISIPRDLYVKIGKYGYSKINAANAYGNMYKYNGSQKGGADLAVDTVSQVIDQPIQYYALVDFSGFKQIIDIIGGVDVTVDKDLYDPFYPGGVFSIKAGQYHMNGDLALKYARSRETTSDFDRAKRQQVILMATKEKILSSQTLLNPAKITGIIQALGDHVKTNMQLWEGQRMLQFAKKIDSTKITNNVIDNSANGLLVNDSSPSAGYILIPRIGLGNYQEIQDFVKNVFTQAGIKAEAAKISVLNGTTRNGLAVGFAERLRNQGLNVVNTGMADRSNFKNTVIYDYSNGQKSSTIAFLKDMLGASVVKGEGTSSSDIEVVLGSDYSQ